MRKQLMEKVPTLFTCLGRLLYIGASTRMPASYLDELIGAGHTVTLLEPWPENVAHYQGHPGLHRVVLGDVRHPNAATQGERYEIVFWWHGPEHVTMEELPGVLARLEAMADLVVLGCPWGIYVQGAAGGNPYEEHLATLYPEDLEALGYETVALGQRDVMGSDLLAWKGAHPKTTEVSESLDGRQSMACKAMRIEEVPTERQIRAFYDKITMDEPVSEKLYRNQFQVDRLNRIKELLSVMLPFAPRVLEMGCCEGLISKWVAPRVDYLLGFDLAKPAIERAKQLGLENAEFVCGDLAKVRRLYADAKFDLVIASEVLEHLCDPEEAMGHLREMATGILASVPVHEFPNPEAFSVEANKRPQGVRGAGDGTGHIWCYRADTLKALFVEVWHYEEIGPSAIIVGR